MAIIRSIFIGRGRKSAGNVTLRHLRGTTIASERIVSNSSNTTLQSRQRKNFRAFSQSFAPDMALLGRLTQKPEGTRSAYNRLFKAVYQPDPQDLHTNAYVFGTLYNNAYKRGSALPYLVHGNAPAAVATIQSAQFQDNYNAIVTLRYYNLTAEQLAKFDGLDEMAASRTYYNSAGNLAQEVTYIHPYLVQDGAAFPAPGSQAVDTLYHGYDGAAYRLQFCVHMTNNSAEASGVSFAKLASLRGLYRFDCNGFIPSIPWDAITA